MPVNSVDALKSRFNTALSSGRVSSYETESLISLVKDGGGVTNSERRQLREQFIANQDKFEPAAAVRMKKFIDEEITGLLISDSVVSTGTGKRDLADPAVMKDDAASLKYQWTSGTAFVNGVSSGDVVQGMIGDCYMMAGFAAVADKHPEAITNALKDNKDGTYTVRFYETSPYGAARAVSVTIDGQLPTKGLGLHYGKGKTTGELWPALLEKAYAQWKGGYQNIGNGGQAGDVMAALTGRNDTFVSLSASTSTTSSSTSSSASRAFAAIEAALKAGKSVAAGTHGESSSEMYKGTGVYAHHAYSVLGTSVENGKQYVTLRNPWGEVEPTGNGVDDGVFKLDLATFSKLYRSVYIS